MPESPQQLRHEFRGQVSALEDGLIAAGNRVLERLDEAMLALDLRDRDRAAAVLRGRERAMSHHHEIQAQILRTITLQAPVASDLRLLAAFIPVNLHIARMGGLCRNIANAVVEDPRGVDDPLVRAQLKEMGQHARRVIESALEAFARRDLDLARNLVALDDPIDVLNRSIFHRTVQLASAEGNFEWVMRMVLVARFIERLGDHAVEIGEQTVYAVTGRLERLS